ncbi:hypothetical protein DSUL_150088 [Desulfovibrionales bacterium]
MFKLYNTEYTNHPRPALQQEYIMFACSDIACWSRSRPSQLLDRPQTTFFIKYSFLPSILSIISIDIFYTPKFGLNFHLR